jgi:hypothetical protein
MNDVIAEGKVTSACVHPNRQDGLLDVSLEGHDPEYLIIGNEAKFSADGEEVSFGDLMKWFVVQNNGPVHAVLHQDPTRYMAVLKAEFTRLQA